MMQESFDQCYISFTEWSMSVSVYLWITADIESLFLLASSTPKGNKDGTGMKVWLISNYLSFWMVNLNMIICFIP